MITRWSLLLTLLCACGDRPAEPVPPAAQAPAPAPAPGEHAEHAQPVEAPVPLPTVAPGAKVFFVAPAEGAKVEGPLENGKVTVKVKMGVEGIAVEPAGPVKEGAGHHHVLVDSSAIAAGTVVPKDEQHLHFGQGQTEADVALTPGEHVLSLQFADGIHRSYGPQLAANVKVTVVAAGTVAAKKDETAKASKDAKK